MTRPALSHSPPLRALALAAVTLAGAFSADPSAAQGARSIRDWVSCDPREDQRDNLARAFAAAAGNAFALVVDCPVFVHVGQDVARPIFLESGLHVRMAKAGAFIVDNVFIPTFVIADSDDIQMTGWNVEYIGSMPTDPETGGYTRGGVFRRRPGKNPPSSAFNDEVLTPWLTQHRGIVFDHMTSAWTGPTNAAATFRILGSSSRLTITGMTFHAAPGADVDHLIPVAFAFDNGFKANQTVTPASLNDPRAMATPSQITVEGLTLDGAYMGFVGTPRDSSFDHITSLRYGDLENADGSNLGGVGKWFAPPHLFYFVANGLLPTENVRITNVMDRGIRLGVARDTSNASLSGYALSLKIGANNSVVSNYVSERPDGVMDVLQSSNLSISNVRGAYNSAFLNNLFPGIRFPGANMHNVTLSHIAIRDNAPISVVPPIGGVNDPWHSDHIVLQDVTAAVNRTAPGVSIMPNINAAASSADVRPGPRR